MRKTEDGLADSRFPVEEHQGGEQTARKREIVALERISDQLALLCRSISRRSRLAASPAGKDTRPSQASVGAWENEGGSLQPYRDLPTGMTASIVTHYHVGSYSYSDFNHAMAELQRQRAGVADPLG